MEWGFITQILRTDLEIQTTIETTTSIPVEIEGNLMHARSEQNTTFHNFQVSRNSQRYSPESVERLNWKDTKKSKWNEVKHHDEAESTNLDIFPPIIWKKSMCPWETLKFWLTCIFWQATVVSKSFTHASHCILNILWQSWKRSLQIVSNPSEPQKGGRRHFL